MHSGGPASSKARSSPTGSRLSRPGGTVAGVPPAGMWPSTLAAGVRMASAKAFAWRFDGRRGFRRLSLGS
ncbi:hypothetical protein [Streptomyces sp. NPDC093544]|uniref:hypothetical protein n=1 Tax=Streptomyces sp. NPDC093544 TaxID=3155200 RepID=UPI003415EFB5